MSKRNGVKLARSAAILAALLICAGCAGMEVGRAPAADDQARTPVVTLSRTPSPSAAPLEEAATQGITTATARATETPRTVATATTSAMGAPQGEPGVTAEAVEADPCGSVHAATREESVDLSGSASALVPPLSNFNQYRFDLVLDRDAATISGTQTVEFINRTGTPLPDLVFHLYPNLPDFGGRLDVSCATVDGAPVTPILEDGDWVLRLPLSVPLVPGNSARVTLRFRTTSPQDAAESYYGAFNAADEIWALASFYPILAIRVDDAWDTLRPNGWIDYVNSDTALYHAQIALPPDHELLASGLVTSTCDSERCAATVAAGPHRDFTLALVQGWEEARRAVGDVEVVSSFPPDTRQAGERALELAADSLARFGETFGAYPYRELDIVPIPAAGFAGVEYPGLLMISDSFYSDPGNPRFDLQDVVVHEVAHMWWYNVVGNDVLREPWLDEGLTSYSAEYLYTEQSGQGEKPLTEERQEQLERRQLNNIPIDGELRSYRDAGEAVAVIYGRAPLFFDALRDELGDEAFFTLLREHYRRNAFGRATTAGFEALAEEVAGRQLDPFLAEWFGRKSG